MKNETTDKPGGVSDTVHALVRPRKPRAGSERWSDLGNCLDLIYNNTDKAIYDGYVKGDMCELVRRLDRITFHIARAKRVLEPNDGSEQTRG